MSDQPSSEELVDKLSDMFGELFGATTPRREGGEDLRVDLVITEDEQKNGGRRDVTYVQRVRCDDCAGLGGTGAMIDCRACAGKGQTMRKEGDLVIATACRPCAGRKQLPEKACKSCERGFVTRTAKVSVTLPAGILADGQFLRLADRGDEGPRGTPNGHLFCAIEIGPDPGAAALPQARILQRGGVGFTMLILGVVLVAMLIHLAGCGDAQADKTSDGAKLAKDDLAALVSKEKISGTWDLGPLYWDSQRKQTRAEARIVLAGDNDPLLDSPPFVASADYMLDLGPPPKLLSKPAAGVLKETATHVAEIDVALGLARAELHKQDRYKYWQKERWKYETRVILSKGHVFVSFDTPNVTDQDISVEIDPSTKKVIAVRLGMA